MLISTLTHTRFLRLQEAFYQEVIRSPVKCKLIVTGVSPDESDAYSQFVGESDRADKEFEIPCLYTRNFTSYTREKYGINQDVSGVVYFAPKILQNIVGYWRLDKLKIRIVLIGEEMLVDTTLFQGELFGSCVCVEVRLKPISKGG